MGLNIIGLGRCVVGNLKKSFNTNPFIDVDIFTHHYILNYRSITESVAQDSKTYKELDHCKSVPSIQEQTKCLDNIANADIIIIELFPPSPLFYNPNMRLACSVENISSCIYENGFINDEIEQSQEERVHGLKNSISKLTGMIKEKNKHAKLVLINGEYYSKKENTGNPFISDIINNIKTLNNIQEYIFINLSELLSTLSIDALAYPDTEFPMQYIRHSQNMIPISISTDCKHASSALRDTLADHLIYKLDLMSTSEKISRLNERFSSQNPDLILRSELFLAETSPCLLNNDSRILARTILYTKILKKKNSHLMSYVDEFLQRKLTYNELKDNFFFIRSISAYLYERNNQDSCILMIKLLENLTTSESQISSDKTRFVILWMKNIIFSINGHIDNNELPYSIINNYLHIITNILNNDNYSRSLEISVLCNMTVTYCLSTLSSTSRH